MREEEINGQEWRGKGLRFLARLSESKSGALQGQRAYRPAVNGLRDESHEYRAEPENSVNKMLLSQPA